MKIFSITNDLDSGGAAKSLFALARSLAGSGHSVHIASISRPSRTSRRVEELSALGVGVDFLRIPYYPMSLVACPIPFGKNVWRAFRRPGEFLRLRRLVQAFKPDVIHYNSYTALLASLPLAGWPAVLHAREVLYENSPLLAPTRALVRSRIREIVAISPVEAEQSGRLFGLPATTVFNPALHAPRLEPMPPGEGLVYGMFSHLSPTKGHLLCIQACAQAAAELRAARVRIRLHGGSIGIHQSLYDSIQAEIDQAGVNDLVSFQGFTASPEEEMRGIHLLLRPDLTGHPWGRDIIEAMSLGRPVLAAGTRETFIRPGVNGMLVPAGDVDAFARAMVELAGKDRLEQMGREAFEFARAHFDPEVNARRTLECLEQAAGMDHPSSSQ